MYKSGKKREEEEEEDELNLRTKCTYELYTFGFRTFYWTLDIYIIYIHTHIFIVRRNVLKSYIYAYEKEKNKRRIEIC